MNRSGVDYSKHEVLVTKSDNATTHYLKRPDTIENSVKFINAGSVMAVTGDFGNWIFCREFHPSAGGYVSDGYWKEKLQYASTQESSEFDPEETGRRLQKMIDTGIEEYGYTGSKADKMREYYQECLNELRDGEFDYQYYAYRNYPAFSDIECVIFCKDTKPWLKAVFDAFDEICNRLTIAAKGIAAASPDRREGI